MPTIPAVTPPPGIASIAAPKPKFFKNPAPAKFFKGPTPKPYEPNPTANAALPIGDFATFFTAPVIF